MANEKITEYVSSVTALENGDLIDVSKDTAGTGLVWESQKMTQTVLRTTLGVNATARYIPVYDGTKIVPSTVYQSAGGNFGVFGVTTPTYSWSFDGETVRTIGVERRTGSANPGLPFTIIGCGAASGSTNQDAGDVNFSTGPSTGNGTGRMTWSLPAPNQGAGTTTRSASAKLYLLGSGYLGIGQVPTAPLEVFTDSSIHTLKIGSNLATILTQTTGIGIMMKRPSDGSYTVHGGMFASATSDMLTFSGFGAGFRFVRNPSTDTVPSVIIGGSSLNGGCNIASGIGAGSTVTNEFVNTYASGSNNICFRTATVGTNSTAVTTAGIFVENTVTTSTAGNNGIYINVTGSTFSSSTRNWALNIVSGEIVTGTNTGLYMGASVDKSIKAYINGSATTPELLYLVNNSISTGTTNLLVALSTNAGTVNKNGLFLQVTGSTTGGGNRAICAYRGNIVSDAESTGGNTQVGIGILNPHASAAIQIHSTTKGLLLTPMTATQASAITPTNGLFLVVSNTDATFTSIGAWCYDNGVWIKL